MKHALIVITALLTFGTISISASQAEAGWRRGWGPGVQVRVAPRRAWWGPRVYAGPPVWWGPSVYVGPRWGWRRW